MEQVKKGDRIRVRDVHGRWLDRQAVTGVQEGYDFPVVWACRIEEWESAHADGREPDATPWPAEDVEVAEPVA